jgi:hypothetical protein
MQFLLAIRVSVNSKVVAIDVQKGLLVLSMIALENFLLVMVFGNGSEKISSDEADYCTFL